MVRQAVYSAPEADEAEETGEGEEREGKTSLGGYCHGMNVIVIEKIVGRRVGHRQMEIIGFCSRPRIRRVVVFFI